MNSRTVYKRLRHARSVNLWGERSYATIIVPSSIFVTPPPERFPEPSAGLVPGSFSGFYQNHEDSDKSTVQVHISEVSCSTHPDKIENKDRVLIVPSTTKSDDDVWSWWECSKHTRTTPADDWTSESYLEPWVLDHIKIEEWKHRAHFDYAHPLLEKLLVSAGSSAKAHYFEVLPDRRIKVTFGVKTCYRNRMVRFSAGFSRALKLARKLDIPVECHI